MADIVERLRDWHDYEPVKMFGGVILKDIDEAADEIERLRAALESLTKDPPATLDEPDDDAEVIIKMRAIARDALNIHHHSETK